MKTRDQVNLEDRWNVEKIFPNLESWRAEFDTLKKGDTPDFSKITQYKGRLGESPEVLKLTLSEILGFERKIARLYSYVQLKHDENIVDPLFKAALGQAQSMILNFQNAVSWFEPELISLAETTQKLYLEAPALAEYKFLLEKVFRMKKHMLTPEMESLTTMALKGMQTSQKAFSTMNDADLTFAPAKDSSGKEHEFTHTLFDQLIRSPDRVLRESAFKSYYKTYFQFENTLSELLEGVVQKHVFIAKSHHYTSALEASLKPKNVQTEVYHSLIKAVRENIAPLHDYYKLRQKIMKLPSIHIWDMYVPLTPQIEFKLTYEESEQTLIEAVAPLGSEYQNLLKKGLYEERWVDRYENKNKRSGAYSGGSYDTQPYILMNYKNVLRDTFTLAHEAGHSMHSLLTFRHQPYHYSDYPIFLAEVASTFNEELLFRHLLDTTPSKEIKIYLINQKLEDIRATLFRQTMFSEFELKIHEYVEKDISLTPDLLKKEYLALNEFYFGSSVAVDKEIELEWARIPHFYYNFYVYQYATGISAAMALSQRVLEGGDKEREDYLGFLKSGSSCYPLETLKKAGVDMTTDQPIKAAIRTFHQLTQELALLLS